MAKKHNTVGAGLPSTSSGQIAPARNYSGIIERYKRYLPVTAKTPVITLNEGNTPLIFAGYLTQLLGKNFEVYLKYEGLNPTGSFKDRGMTLAISKACEDKSKAVICASTGNTSASAAAYSARAGIKCVVLLPKGAIALGKLSQALIHDAKVLAVEGNFDDALNLVKEISLKYPITLVNSLNPYRIEGQKTGSFEICDYLGDAPDFQVMPVGNAGNITAYWKGYKEYKSLGLSKKLPRMLGFQAEGAAPIVRGYPIERPETIATAIRIGNPASWKQAEAARDESSGLIDMVSDKEILNAYKLLASQEGVFAEPASAASVAGLLKLAGNNYFKKIAFGDNSNERFSPEGIHLPIHIKEGCYTFPYHKKSQTRDDPDRNIGSGGRRNTKIVCILTGHGLKDPDRAIKTVQEPKLVKPNLKAILNEIGY